jgi:hypothetical protein
MSHRIQKIQSRHPQNLSHLTIPWSLVTRPDPARAPKVAQEEVPCSVFLVARRPPLSEHGFVWRWLARWIYRQIHWTPDYGIEYQGVYIDESAARHAASGDGMFCMEVPLNESLPEQTCQFGSHDFPLSEASHEYRNRKLPFVAVPRGQIERLRDKIKTTDLIIEGFRAKAI